LAKSGSCAIKPQHPSIKSYNNCKQAFAHEISETLAEQQPVFMERLMDWIQVGRVCCQLL
ncbi:hypothetical protein AVEN_102129-1, partial [Araneus ventricosus]